MNRQKETMRVAGLMSGTSADGVDVAIVDIGRGGVSVLAFDTFSYPRTLRQRILAVCDPQTARLDEICHLNFVVGEVFSQALIRLTESSSIPLSSIDLIGSHGQTIYHDPTGSRFGGRLVRSTLQIGEPSVIAERTGITTVADFRPRDIAAGGEGAPLVPYADFFLFSDKHRNRVLQNIGGIANVTFLPAGGDMSKVIAFDTGPGNMIIDRITHVITAGKSSFDRAGKLAARGKVNLQLLGELMDHRFLRRRPPKSTGREEFGLAFSTDLYRRARARQIAPLDILATVTAFTAKSIASAYRRFLPSTVDEVILCGGGAWNCTLVSMLRSELHPANLMTTDDFGISIDAKEAVSFAILAYQTMQGRANNVPSATGAGKSVVLGKIIPASGMKPLKWRGGKSR
jgi:anhydro-N-acetylmuramic acid kinase